MFEKVAHPAAFFLDWPEVSSSLQKKAERQEGRKEQGKSQTCTTLGPGTDTCAMFCINGIFGMSGVFRCTENQKLISVAVSSSFFFAHKSSSHHLCR